MKNNNYWKNFKKRLNIKNVSLSWVLWSFFLWSSSLWAARWLAPRHDKPSLKLGFVGSSMLVDIEDPKGVARPAIQYRPNSLGRLTLGIEYLGLGASAGLTGSGDPKKEAQLGTTKGIDYQFRFFREQNTFDLFYQKYQGFYVLNSKEIDPTIQGDDPFLQRPDLHTEHIGVQYFRTLSPDDFSMAAAFEQSGWQKESGGTWFFYGGIDKHHLDAESALVPASVAAIHPLMADFKQGDFMTGKLGVGGAYILVFNEFFLATKLIASFGQQQQKYVLSQQVVEKTIPMNGGNLKISLGYNGDSYYTSLNLFNDSTGITIEDRKISLGTMEISWFVGLHM